jgi:hypothetical protein
MNPSTSLTRFEHVALRAGAWCTTRRNNCDLSCRPCTAGSCAGAWRPTRRINRDLVALFAPAAVAQARARQTFQSRLTLRFPCERPRAFDPCARSPREREQFCHTILTRRVVPHLITSFSMFGRGITTLAFSCEAARVTVQCTQDAARLRLLQRPVRRQLRRHGQFCRLRGSVSRDVDRDAGRTTGRQVVRHLLNK